VRKLLALLVICGLFSLGCGGDTSKDKGKPKEKGGPPSGMDKGKPPMGDRGKPKEDMKDKDEDKPSADKNKPEKPSPDKKDKEKDKDKNGVP
jgi:hypothetical protein